MQKSFLKRDLSIGSATQTGRAVFAKHLAVMLQSGIPISEALEIAIDSSQGVIAKSLRSVLDAVRSGRSLSSAFADHPRVFSPLLINATHAGEESGTLSSNLERVALELQKQKELTDKVRGAMLYPLVVLIAALFLGLGVAFFILPKITPLFKGLRIELPLTTRALISFSSFMEVHGLAVIGSVVFFILFIVWLWRQPFARPVTHWIILKIPVTNKISRNANLARFCSTLATLLKSGIRIDEALTITKTSVGNYHYEQAISRASVQIRKGAKLWESLSVSGVLFPVLVTRMIRVGEESGRFEETLSYLARFYEEEIDTATKSLTTTLEPLLLLVIGLLVAGLALAIITPIYEITGSFRRR